MNRSAQKGEPPITEDGRPDRGLYQLAVGEDEVAWRSRSRIVLSPMAAPSIMGLFGFAIATLMVGAWQAGWYGNANSPLVLWPFALFVGGIPQFIAAIFALRARDATAVAVHTVWGAFWTGWGILQLLVTTHVLPAISPTVANPAFAFWFIGLAVVTISAMLASLADSLGVFVTLGTLSAGSCLTAAGFFSGANGVIEAGGWLFVISAAAAWYTATAMMLEHAFGRTIIPQLKYNRAANLPGAQLSRPVAFDAGMPGVRVGQ
jgi:succinate-acetate transporter protein